MFYEQKLRHIGFKPYPNDGLVTFGASGTDMCDRQLAFKNAKGVRPEKSADIPFRGRQRRIGNAVVDFIQLDIAHMVKRLGPSASFTFNVRDNGEWNFEDAAQERVVFEYPHPETGELVKFAITAKPDGILDYVADDSEKSRIIFEYKTKASGLRIMNGKLDYKGADSGHVRQVTAESLVFGIRDVLIVYESTQKPSWFDDTDNSSVTKGQKTWEDGAPRKDLRAFHYYVTDAMQTELLSGLARQAALVYSGEIPDVTIEMTDKCGFCAFSGHCKTVITPYNLAKLQRADSAMSASQMAGKAEHRRLQAYLSEVGV